MTAPSRRWWPTFFMVSALGCDPTPLPPRTATPAAPGSSGAERAAPTPAPQDPDAVRAGRALFDSACGSCHSGESPRGGALTNAGKTAAEILSVLHAGSEDGGIMPAVDPRTLREEDLPALRAYLRSIGAER